jgi:hypothetical protein
MRASVNVMRRASMIAFAFTLIVHPMLVSSRPAEAVAQASSSPFGPFEQVRQQAHASCVGYLQGGDARLYLQCLQQFSFHCSSLSSDFLAYQWCTAAATTPYPAPGQRLLAARSYRVEVIGGWDRERDPQTGALLSERPLSPALAYTLDRQPNGLYLATSYNISTGQVSQFWVTDRCEIPDDRGQPTIDAIPCPVFPDKPFLVNLIPPPDPNFAPSPQIFSPGRLADDFDEDGVVEIGYLYSSGSGGRSFTSGSAEAIGYDPETRALKFVYRMAVRESDNPYTTFAVERLYRFRVHSSP